jgi:hypothetical protein
MMIRGFPIRLWDYGLIWATETGNMTLNGSASAKGLPPETLITRDVPEISSYWNLTFMIGYNIVKILDLELHV